MEAYSGQHEMFCLIDGKMLDDHTIAPRDVKKHFI